MVVISINPKIPITLICLRSNTHSLKDTGGFNTCLGLQTSDINNNNKAQRTEKPVALNKYTTKFPIILGCYVMFLVICFLVFRDAVLFSYARVEL
jgi:hypothetical protein